MGFAFTIGREFSCSNASSFMFLQEDYTWSSIEGRKVQLANTPLSALSVPECIALQRVAQTRLKQLNLKCHVTIPKGIVWTHNDSYHNNAYFVLSSFERPLQTSSIAVS